MWTNGPLERYTGILGVVIHIAGVKFLWATCSGAGERGTGAVTPPPPSPPHFSLNNGTICYLFVLLGDFKQLQKLMWGLKQYRL